MTSTSDTSIADKVRSVPPSLAVSAVGFTIGTGSLFYMDRALDKYIAISRQNEVDSTVEAEAYSTLQQQITRGDTGLATGMGLLIGGMLVYSRAKRTLQR